jgi:hypothetical protein
MKTLIKFCGIWGIADAFWLAGNPLAWGRFWQRAIAAISGLRALAAVLAVFQLSICLWLLMKTRD